MSRGSGPRGASERRAVGGCGVWVSGVVGRRKGRRGGGWRRAAARGLGWRVGGACAPAEAEGLRPRARGAEREPPPALDLPQLGPAHALRSGDAGGEAAGGRRRGVVGRRGWARAAAGGAAGRAGDGWRAREGADAGQRRGALARRTCHFGGSGARLHTSSVRTASEVASGSSASAIAGRPRQPESASADDSASAASAASSAAEKCCR